MWHVACGSKEQDTSNKQQATGGPVSGRLVILSGPSGVGKDTVLDAWRARNPRVRRVVAYTTRPMRPGEVDGVDYNFVSVDRFREMAAEGAFLEFKEVFGNLYATPLTDMEAMLGSGQIAVLKIDVQGALTAMQLRPDAVTAFIIPPSMDELERRIRDRATDSPEVIDRRLRTARDEIALKGEYQHVFVNDDVGRLVDRLEALVQ
jgi:guanylate kinase